MHEEIELKAKRLVRMFAEEFFAEGVLSPEPEISVVYVSADAI